MFNHSELECLYMGEKVKHSNELTEFLEICDMLVHK